MSASLITGSAWGTQHTPFWYKVINQRQTRNGEKGCLFLLLFYVYFHVSFFLNFTFLSFCFSFCMTCSLFPLPFSLPSIIHLSIRHFLLSIFFLHFLHLLRPWRFRPLCSHLYSPFILCFSHWFSWNFSFNIYWRRNSSSILIFVVFHYLPHIHSYLLLHSPSFHFCSFHSPSLSWSSHNLSFQRSLPWSHSSALLRSCSHPSLTPILLPCHSIICSSAEWSTHLYR